MYDDLLFLINAFLNDCLYPVVYRIEVWCDVRNLVLQQLGALVHVWCTGK